MIGRTWASAVACLAALVTAWTAGFVWFAITIPDTVTDPSSHTDAIVVLTGGSERIETGLKLLAEGRADRLYVSGIGGQLRRGDLLAQAMSDPDLGPRIALGTAANTPGNAAETAAWAEAE